MQVVRSCPACRIIQTYEIQVANITNATLWNLQNITSIIVHQKGYYIKQIREKLHTRAIIKLYMTTALHI